MVKIYTFSKTRVSLAPIDVTPNYRPSSCNSSLRKLVPALALTLHQVKAHDVRAFAASKAFQSGVSLEQILSACHWKSHNTFTQFYLKDVAWADTELSFRASGGCPTGPPPSPKMRRYVNMYINKLCT